MRNRAYRRHKRYTKGMKRLLEDRAQHSADRNNDLGWKECPCMSEEARQGKGAVFARFADTPKLCSRYCCGNRRRYGEVTLQERKEDERWNSSINNTASGYWE